MKTAQSLKTVKTGIDTYVFIRIYIKSLTLTVQSRMSQVPKSRYRALMKIENAKSRNPEMQGSQNSGNKNLNQ